MNGRGGITVGDFMCGGGGSSTGMRRFFERERIRVKRFVAVNHDPDAIETHSWNHPDVEHFCQDLGHVDLHRAFPDGVCDFAWASPSCTQLSRARGGRPIDDQLRNGPWQLLTVATEIYVARWAIENVGEILDWAPLDARGRPITSRRGEIFEAWKRAMETLYDFEWRIHNAADFGAPTTRERFIALLKHKRLRGPIVWAVPTHARDGAGDLFTGHKERWVGARKFLDLSLPTKRVAGRSTPLAAPTLARGWHGMRNLWCDSAARVYSPDVRDAVAEGIAYVRAELPKAERDLAGAMRWRPKKPVTPAQLRAKRRARKTRLETRVERLRKALPRYEKLHAEVVAYLAERRPSSSGEVHAFLVNLRGTDDSHVGASASALNQPVPGLSAGGSHVGIATPQLKPIVVGNRAHNTARTMDEPTGGLTTATGGGLFLVAPGVDVLILGQHGGGIARTAESPMQTLATDGAAAMIAPIFAPYYGEKDGRARASRTVDEPLATASTENRFGIVAGEAEPMIVGQHGNATPRDIGEPMATLATDGGPWMLAPKAEGVGAEAMVLPQHKSGNHLARDLDAPVPSVSTTGALSLIEPIIVPSAGEAPARSVGEPIGALRTTPRGERIVEPYLVESNHGLTEDERANHGARTRALDETAGCLTTKNGLGVAQPFLIAHFGEREGQAPRVHDPEEPFPSVTHRGAGDLIAAAVERARSLDPALLERIVIGEDGNLYVARLHYRMLSPTKELALVMGFPRDYKWPDSNTKVTKLVGNAVHVDWADAVVSAFLSDLVPRYRESDGEAVA